MSGSWIVSRRRPIGAFVVGLALAAVLAHSPSRTPPASSRRTAASAGARSDRGRIRGRDLARRRPTILPPVASRGPLPRELASSGPAAPAWENVDDDARNPAMYRRHARLLRAEPLLQRLPYSDRKLGVQLVGTTPSGRPVLLVTYRGSMRRARNDMRSLLSRFEDGGGEYATRYERLESD